MESFKSNEVRIMVATDVVSRGLDIKDITYVINYDFPRHIEDYVIYNRDILFRSIELDVPLEQAPKVLLLVFLSQTLIK